MKYKLFGKGKLMYDVRQLSQFVCHENHPFWQNLQRFTIEWYTCRNCQVAILTPGGLWGQGCTCHSIFFCKARTGWIAFEILRLIFTDQVLIPHPGHFYNVWHHCKMFNLLLASHWLFLLLTWCQAETFWKRARKGVLQAKFELDPPPRQKWQFSGLDSPDQNLESEKFIHKQCVLCSQVCKRLPHLRP